MRSSVVLLALAACTTPAAGPDGVTRVETKLFPLTPTPQLDLLLVIDGSPAMAAAQARLAPGIARLVDVVSQVFPVGDLHVAVTTADGTGALVGTGCLAPGASWLRFARGGNGATTRNFDGALGDAVACMANVGTAGPAQRQPLLSMRRAIESHLGLVRAGAELAVVIIASGDDCSGLAADPFACAAQAMTCDEPDLAAPGEKHHCHAVGVDDYTSFLGRLPPFRLISAVIGPPAPVVVTAGPAIAPSCTAGPLTAQPGVRIAGVADTVTSLCDGDFADALARLRGFTDPGGIPCFEAPVTSDCAVTLVRGGVETRVPACDPLDYATPCWTMRTDPGFACQYASVDFGDADVPPGVTVRASCAVE
jgi:hypothetical protein